MSESKESGLFLPLNKGMEKGKAFCKKYRGVSVEKQRVPWQKGTEVKGEKDMDQSIGGKRLSFTANGGRQLREKRIPKKVEAPGIFVWKERKKILSKKPLVEYKAVQGNPVQGVKRTLF